jgi:hypothetical protein
MSAELLYSSTSILPGGSCRGKPAKRPRSVRIRRRVVLFCFNHRGGSYRSGVLADERPPRPGLLLESIAVCGQTLRSVSVPKFRTRDCDGATIRVAGGVRGQNTLATHVSGIASYFSNLELWVEEVNR